MTRNRTITKLLQAKALINEALREENHKPSKADQLIKMLERPSGATIEEVIEEFGIKKNSAYARISVEARHRNLKVERVDGHYHVAH